MSEKGSCARFGALCVSEMELSTTRNIWKGNKAKPTKTRSAQDEWRQINEVSPSHDKNQELFCHLM